jgi:hypothetical protein
MDVKGVEQEEAIDIFASELNCVVVALIV